MWLERAGGLGKRRQQRSGTPSLPSPAPQFILSSLCTLPPPVHGKKVRSATAEGRPALVMGDFNTLSRADAAAHAALGLRAWIANGTRPEQPWATQRHFARLQKKYTVRARGGGGGGRKKGRKEGKKKGGER